MSETERIRLIRQTLLRACQGICSPGNGVTDTVWMPGQGGVTVVDALLDLAVGFGATDDELSDAIAGTLDGESHDAEPGRA